MEKIKSGNKKNATIRVQFEYSNDNDVINLSREFKINISLDENTDFEINKRKILKESNFQTQEQRNNYHMFNKSKKKFLTKNSDFISYINTNSPVILINCYEYCDNVIRKLNEETNIFFNKGKTIGSDEIKRKEFINELSCLENNFDVDIFANEFIPNFSSSFNCSGVFVFIVPWVKYLSLGFSLALSSFVFALGQISTSFFTILLIKSTPPAFKNSSKFLLLFNNELSIFNPFNFSILLLSSFKFATALSSSMTLARPPFLIIVSANFGFRKAK